MIYNIDDFEHPEPNGLGVSFAYILWQMILLRDRDFRVRITKPNNPYREPARGENVWDYYFDQQPVEGPSEKAPLEHPIDLALSGHRDWTLARQRLIQPFAARHIRLRPEIQAEVDSFRKQYFKGKVLAVHLRGTDKRQEYRAMNPGAILATVRTLRERLGATTIFLMTDDVEYHALLQPLGYVSQDIPRSKQSLHHNPPVSRYHSGLSVVMDGFLAASADWFAYTPSNTAVIPLAMGKHEEIIRINQHCVIEPFCPRVDRAIGL